MAAEPSKVLKATLVVRTVYSGVLKIQTSEPDQVWSENIGKDRKSLLPSGKEKSPEPCSQILRAVANRMLVTGQIPC
jgi:hypothetical protein